MSFAARLRRWAGVDDAAGIEPRFDVAHRTHVGRVRTVNEDRVLVRNDRCLWAVADGMGGHTAGAAAAAAAVDALDRLARRPGTFGAAALVDALGEANRTIHARGDSATGTSGTTVVAALLEDRTATIAWVGDSRAYLIREGAATPLTRDHSVVQELLDAGLLTPESAIRHPQANVVTRALGIGPQVAVDTVSVALAPGDRILLCSDGVSHSLGPRDFAGAPVACDALAERLLTNALQRDGSDNASLVVIAPDRPSAAGDGP